MSKCEQCLVKQLNSLNKLNKEDLLQISKCKTTLKIKKGETIFEEGEHINGIFCVNKGFCKISKISTNGREQIVSITSKGDFIGKRSLVHNGVTNLKATAVSDMEICFIPRKEIIKDLEKNSNFSMSFLKEFANSLKDANNVLVNMGQKSVKQRLADLLLKLEEKFGKNQVGMLAIQLSREDIANVIGTATESAIRLLSEFKKNKIIELHGKNIKLVDLAELKRLSNGF